MMTVYELIQELVQYDANFTVEFVVKETEEITMRCENCKEEMDVIVESYSCDIDKISGSNVFKEVKIELN